MPRVRLCLALLAILVCLSTAAVPGLAAPAANWMWIWTTDGEHPPETVFFRQKFRLAKAPVSARLLITADDQFTVYLNERKQPIGAGQDWTTVQEFDVTAYVHAGQNLLAIEAVNNAGAGGLLYKLVLKLPGNKSQILFSDGRVKFSRRPPPVVWQTLAFDDASWQTAKEVAPAGGGSWGPLRGAPVPDPSRIVRRWDLRAGGEPGDDPYSRPRHIGDRMILSASVAGSSDMQILSGAGFTLFQTDSDHLSTDETGPGQWSWREPDAARRLVQSLGLSWSYFPHMAFPPAWYRQQVKFTRIQCREHGQTVEAFSPWDPTWTDFVAGGYQALAREFGAKKDDPKKPALPTAAAPRAASRNPISALYVGIHGDYGEAGLLSGARVSVPGQKEDWVRRFGNAHDHIGWWCDDALARADFRNTMMKKYGSLEKLNAAWKREYKAPEEIAFPDAVRPEARREWIDYVDWYRGSVGKAVELNLGAARAEFPNTLLMLPVGFGDEDLRGGNDNSLLPKLAARFKADVRSTHSAFKPFADNAATMFGRLGSACRFYGTPFWTEPPSGLTEDQEAARIFESVSQGAKGFFDWSSNAVANRTVFYRYGKYLRVEKPVVDVAMFYPATAMKLHPEQGYAPLFAYACANLRDSMNFDIVDDRMVLDGCMANYRVLVLWEGAIMEQSTLDKLKAWVNDGGVLVAYDFGKIQSVTGDLGWFTDLFGYVRELKAARINERYAGKLPAQYRISMGRPESSDYLSGEWYEPDTTEGVTRRWTGANAIVRLPMRLDKRYTLVIRATVPEQTVGLSHKIYLNNEEVGDLGSPGDVTYRFRIPEQDDAGPTPVLGTLAFRCETFQPTKTIPGAKDERNLGVEIHSAALVEQGIEPSPDADMPAGAIRRELDLRSLKGDWTRQYGKGLTVYFPATRQLLKGYLEVVKRIAYHLSDIDPARRDALPIDVDGDGVFSTLFTDKILLYNSKDTAIVKTITIPAEKFAAWRGEVAIPSQTTWTVNLEPHSLGAINFTAPPQELLLECEKFLEPGSGKLLEAADCSPGKGPTCVRMAGGTTIATRFPVDTAGTYAVYVRAVRNGKPEPVDILIDGQVVSPVNTRAGQTIYCGTAALTHGVHALTLRTRDGRDVRADFVLLTNDPTVSGYNFAVRTVPVE